MGNAKSPTRITSFLLCVDLPFDLGNQTSAEYIVYLYGNWMMKLTKEPPTTHGDVLNLCTIERALPLNISPSKSVLLWSR
jgi:hypothetical protein